jgi:hypothetical protein
LFRRGLRLENAAASPGVPHGTSGTNELDDVRAIILWAENHDVVLAGGGHRSRSLADQGGIGAAAQTFHQVALAAVFSMGLAADLSYSSVVIDN